MGPFVSSFQRSIPAMLSFHRADHRLCQFSTIRLVVGTSSRTLSTRSAINKGLRADDKGPTYKRSFDRSATSSSGRFERDPFRARNRSSRDESSPRSFGGERRDAPSSRYDSTRSPRDGNRREPFAKRDRLSDHTHDSRKDDRKGFERSSLFGGPDESPRGGSFGARDSFSGGRDRSVGRAPARGRFEDDSRDNYKSRDIDRNVEAPSLGMGFKNRYEPRSDFVERRGRFDSRNTAPRRSGRDADDAPRSGVRETLHFTDDFKGSERRFGEDRVKDDFKSSGKRFGGDRVERPRNGSGEYQNRRRNEDHGAKEKSYGEKGGHNQQDFDDGVPISIPYTTAASRFLYGRNVVVAALTAQRRKLHRLYMCQDIQGDESGTSEFHPKKVDFRRKQFFELLELARDADVTVDSKADVRLLNKLSENRPHNGVVLEASPAPTPPLLSLGQFDPETSRIPLTIAEQSVEEKAVNGTPQFLRVRKESWRKPFVVMLDGILDPGNVGNIIRTCHFFGADAVVIATNTCANITSPTLIKASSGAYETLPIYLLPQPSNFLFESAKTGWKVYAAMPPDASTAPSPSERPRKATTSFEVASASPLLDDPCILVLGSEGTGLRANLQKRSEYFVSIERNVVENDISSLVGVDSVNVAVAAGILTQAFLNKPSGAADKVVPPKSHFTDNFLRTPGDEERHQAVMQALNDPVDGAVDPALEGADAMADPVLEDADSVVDPVPEEAGGVVDPAPEDADTVVDPVSEATDTIVDPVSGSTDGEVDPTLEIAGDEAAVEQEVTDGKTKDVAH